MVFAGKLAMGLGRITADADNLSASLLKYLVIIPECTGFHGTTGSVVFGVEKQDNGFFAEKVTKTNYLTIRTGQGKIWCFVSNL